MTTSIGDQLIDIERKLAFQLEQLAYPDPVEFVYNPLSYAILPHTDFIHKYANDSPKDVLFLGMNPGPWGMGQTGVPFGEVQHVKEWLLICNHVQPPASIHPSKPILGFSSKRREVSGERFWSFIKSECKVPEMFFKHCLVYNHCPLMYLDKKGKNLTPQDLDKSIREAILSVCDEALQNVIQLYKVKHIIGIGRYAETRSKKVLQTMKLSAEVQVHFISHPSPRNAASHKGWDISAREALSRHDLLNIIQGKV